MPTILVYNLADESMYGFYTFRRVASGDVYPRDSVTQGKIQIPDNHPAIHEQHKWRVSSGVLVQKNEVVISSNKAQIVADGIDEATITFAYLVAPVSVSFGEGLNQTATPADPVIILTSDVPRQFVIEIDDKLHFAEPIFVEAK